MPSWVAVPEDVQLESLPLQKRAKVVLGLCAGVTLLGSLTLATLNLLAWQPLVAVMLDRLDSSLPKLTSLVFWALALCIGYGLWRVGHPQSNRNMRASGTSRLQWLQAFKATGSLFHSKVAFLEVLQLVNQARWLVRLLRLGQPARWIGVYSLLICLNAVITPMLHFSERIQRNTFFLTLFDAVMDAIFGAVLPACMVAEVGFQYLTMGQGLLLQNMQNDPQLLQAILIGKCFVPDQFSQLVSLAWPYISFCIKLADMRQAQEVWRHDSFVDRRERVCGPRVFGSLFLLAGLTVGLLGLTARLRSPCFSRHWQEGCRVFRFDLLGASCECTFYMANGDCSNQTILEEMLQDSKSLQMLTLESCWPHSTFPSLASNAQLQYLYLPRNRLQELPSLSSLVNLVTLRVDRNLLRALPNLSANKALRVLEVEYNMLTELPSLEGNPELMFLLARHNRIGKPPTLFVNKQLVVLDLHGNLLKEPPSLATNRQLKNLILSFNRLRSFPTLDANAALEHLLADHNQLEALPPLVHLPLLGMLDCSSNRIQQLPGLDRNTRLHSLDVSYNQLRSLPSLSALRQLTNLAVNSNDLEEIPRLSDDARLLILEVSHNTKLRHLDLSGPQFQALMVLQAANSSLEDIAGLGKLFHLYTLVLPHNSLKQLDGIGSPDLLSFDVRNNKLRVLPSLRGCLGLMTLLADGNRLTELPKLDNLKSLHKLSLRSNSLASLPLLPHSLHELYADRNLLRWLPDFQGFYRLSVLCVAHNKLQELPDVYNLKHLGTLGCSDNPVREPPVLSPENHQFFCDCCAGAVFPQAYPVGCDLP